MTEQKIAAFGSSYRVYANPMYALPKAAIFALKQYQLNSSQIGA